MNQATKEIGFIFPLSEKLEDRLRVFASTRKNRVVKFVVQYEALIRDKWRPIVRYDTSHGFAHKDILHFRGEEDKQPFVFSGLQHGFYLCHPRLENLLEMV